MYRTSKADIEYLVDRLNEMTNNPQMPTTMTDDGFQYNIGSYYYREGNAALLHRIEQVATSGGGCSDILYGETKKELYGKLDAMLKGIELVK